MTNKQCERRLAQALGALHPKTDFSAVAGAMPAPSAATPVSISHPRHLRRYVAAVAAAAVMVAGVGIWWYTRPEDKPPVIPADTVTTTTDSAVGTITTTDNAVNTTTTTVGTAGSTDATGSAATSATSVTKKPTTTKPTQGGGFTTPEVTPVTSLKEAKAAIADGRYEAAYLYLLTDTSKEAAKLLENFIYVPVGKTDTQNGKVYGTGSWTYDEMGLPGTESVLNASSGVKAETRKLFTYDAQGRVKTKTYITLKDGKETGWEEYTYTYDAAGYLVRKDYNDPAAAYAKRWTRVYAYDERGNRIREELTGEGYHHTITTFTYNAANQLLVRLESYVESGSWTKQEYVYDAAGRVLTDAKLSSSGYGWTYTYTYDENGVQTSYSHTLPDDPNHWQKWYMDGNQKVHEDSQGHTGNYSMWIEEDGKPVYSYSIDRVSYKECESFFDEDGKRLMDVTWTGKSGYYSRYTYDKRGNCVEETRYTYTNRNAPEASSTLYGVLNSYTYVYDSEGRVLEKKHTNSQGKVTTYVYAYDDAGRTIKDGQLSKKGVFYGKEYTFNDAGLVLTQKEIWGDGSWEMVTNTYDKDGHKIGVEHTCSDGTWKKAIYDAAGNLLRWENHQGILYTYTWELRYYPDGLTPEHREELNAFRDAAGESELHDESSLLDA